MTRRFLLDTNIISDAQRPEPDLRLADWMEDQADEALFVAAVVPGEVWQGILQLDEGRKRRALLAWFEGPSGPPGLFAGRVLPLDQRAALQWAEFVAEGRRSGQPRGAVDMQIAAIARVNGCALVTRNVKHFAAVRGTVEVIDPSGIRSRRPERPPAAASPLPLRARPWYDDPSRGTRPPGGAAPRKGRS